MILNDNEDLFHVYENYLRNGTELTLSSDLLHLVRLESNYVLRQRTAVSGAEAAAWKSRSPSEVFKKCHISREECDPLCLCDLIRF